MCRPLDCYRVLGVIPDHIRKKVCYERLKESRLSSCPFPLFFHVEGLQEFQCVGLQGVSSRHFFPLAKNIGIAKVVDSGGKFGEEYRKPHFSEANGTT